MAELKNDKEMHYSTSHTYVAFDDDRESFPFFFFSYVYVWVELCADWVKIDGRLRMMMMMTLETR